MEKLKRYSVILFNSVYRHKMTIINNQKKDINLWPVRIKYLIFTECKKVGFFLYKNRITDSQWDIKHRVNDLEKLNDLVHSCNACLRLTVGCRRCFVIQTRGCMWFCFLCGKPETNIIILFHVMSVDTLSLRRSHSMVVYYI